MEPDRKSSQPSPARRAATAVEIVLFGAVVVGALLVLELFGVLDDPLGGLMTTFR